jgi:hypothetical protein
MSCSGAKSWGGRRSRKQRGGNGYGFGPAITPGALEVVSNRTSVVDGAPNPMGGRRRKSRKGKKSRRTRRRRSMRGGGSVAGVGYGFSGDGARGLAIQSGYPSNLPPGGAFEIPTGTR